MAKIGIEATKAQIEKAVEVTDGSILTGEDSVALKGTASGDYSVAIRGTASGKRSTAINANASGDFSVSIGGAMTDDNSVGIGLNAKATGKQSVAIGICAEAKQTNAVQIGEGENNTAQTLQFRNYQLLKVDGTIPDDRMKSTIDGTTKTVTEWLTQVINASSGKPISSITLVDNKLRITYTDGTYVESGDLSASSSTKGIIKTATDSEVILKASGVALTPQNINRVVKQGLINNSLTMSAAEKNAAANWLGYMLSSDVSTALAGKQDVLTFDTTPTENSTNPVTSGGVYTAVNAKQDKSSSVTLTDNSTTALADNTEYIATNATTLTFTYPQGDFECYMTLSFADSGTITVTFPTSQYIGTVPTFGNGETWEISIKNGVIVAGKVESNA